MRASSIGVLPYLIEMAIDPLRAGHDSIYVFVYGTLQRGQKRAAMWPCTPLWITRATTRGRLYDLKRYPALVEGEDCVAGELWEIAADDVARTLEALDRIECFGQDDVDLYVRRTTNCEMYDGHSVVAEAYFFAHPEELPESLRILPDEEGICRWPGET